MVFSEYTWIFAVGVLTCIFMAWGIGANDVANSFATSVGARALTLRQAIIVAMICEFGGAVLLGSGVTATIRGGIAKTSYYVYQPELLMFGMLCALAAAGIWMLTATYFELPVSTTHSIVGAIIGMSLVVAGGDSIVWSKPPSASSPFPGGVVAIVLAWLITPAMAAVVAGLLFTFTKVVVLTSKQPFRRALMLFPLYTFITTWIITFFVIQKGVNGWIKSKTYTNCPAGSSAPASKYKVVNGEQQVTGCTIPDGTNAWISAVTAAACTVVRIAALRWIAKLVERDYEYAKEVEGQVEMKSAYNDPEAAKGDEHAEPAAIVAVPVESENQNDPEKSRTPEALQDFRRSKVWRTVTYGASYDIHKSIQDDEKIMAIHNNADVFDLKSELTFKYLQVLTACANSFAHGANDVANAVAAFAAIYEIWQCTCINNNADVPIWMYVIGGSCIGLGVATFGYRIMRVLGVKLLKLTNSRGYCAELTSATIVIIASRYGFPVSTTQVITGALTGIGLAEAISASVQGRENPVKRFNYLLLVKFFGGWIATLVVAGLTAALFTALGIFSPNKYTADWRMQFNEAFNSTNYGMSQTLIAAGNVPTPSSAQQQALEWGIALVNATKFTHTSNDPAILDPSTYLATFQQGTYYLGNTTQAGVLTNVYMSNMPINGLPFVG